MQSCLHQAHELRESYPDVSFIVVDKLDYVSGSVPTSGGAMAAISSSLHKASDSECTTQDFVDLFEFTSNQKVNESLVKNVYEKSDVVMNRVLDFGAPFGEAPQQASPYSEKVTAFWTDGGGAALGQFMNQLVKDEPFDLRLSTRAEELIVEDGKVVGVVVADKTTRHEIRAKAVLLATGGFGSNPDYMHEWLPQFADGCDYMEGGSIKQDVSEACRIFEKAGADLLDISGGFNGFTIKGNSKPGWFSDLSALAKENVSIPVLVTGGIKSADDAEQILLSGAADLIGVGRAMLKNPDWADEATV